MNVRRFLFVVASVTALAGGIFNADAVAQDPFGDDDAVIKLFNEIEEPASSQSSRSDVRRSQMSVAELRQARALYRSNQRVARLEHNLWMGHEPLRPKWNAIPMMTSRYSARRIYVPVYIRAQ